MAKKSSQLTLGQVLVRYQLELSNQRGRLLSDNDIAKHLEVSNISYGRWKNDMGRPKGANIHKLAAKIGPIIYDILGEPRLMPDDPLLRKVAENWHSLSDDTRSKIMEIIEQSNDEMARDPV